MRVDSDKGDTDLVRAINLTKKSVKEQHYQKSLKKGQENYSLRSDNGSPTVAPSSVREKLSRLFSVAAENKHALIGKNRRFPTNCQEKLKKKKNSREIDNFFKKLSILWPLFKENCLKKSSKTIKESVGKEQKETPGSGSFSKKQSEKVKKNNKINEIKPVLPRKDQAEVDKILTRIHSSVQVVFTIHHSVGIVPMNIHL